MAKAIKAKVKLQCPAGGANPHPGRPALSQHGVNIGEFVKRFNADTAKQKASSSVIVTVYMDKSSTALQDPPASVLLCKAAGIEKGSGEPNKNKVGKVTKAQIAEIAKVKAKDLNASSPEAASRSLKAQRGAWA